MEGRNFDFFQLFDPVEGRGRLLLRSLPFSPAIPNDVWVSTHFRFFAWGVKDNYIFYPSPEHYCAM